MTTPAYRADGAPVSREAFYALACDPRRSAIVEACAGAGKTWMLVSRILRALLDGTPPHEILAITFTRKAAGEMRARLNEWLREFGAMHASDAARIEALVQRGVAPAEARRLAPELAGLHARLLAGGRPVEIRTFHAWFAQLLRAAPLELLDELGLQPDMALIEEIDDHRAEVFRRFHAAIVRDPALRADHLALTAARGRHVVRQWLEAAWDKRVEFELADAAGVLDDSVPSGAPGRDDAAAAVDSAGAGGPDGGNGSDGRGRADGAGGANEAGGPGGCRGPDGAGSGSRDGDGADGPGAPDRAADVDGAPGDPACELLSAHWHAELRALALVLGRGGATAQNAATGLVLAIGVSDARVRLGHARSALFTNSGAPRKKLGDVAALAPVQQALDAVVRRVRQFDAHHEHRRMVRLARVLLAEYAAYKRARGLADMADLERCGLALLRDATLAGWVQERLDARIRHVLIDEFQDTSPLQWHALHAWWSAYAGAGGGASGQRPPSVFIVGDPKQSIYRFRRAEPRVFDAARAFAVDALGAVRLACDHTRRNAPEVLTALNAVFGAAQRAREFDGFRAHTTEVGAGLADAGVFALARVPRPAAAPRGRGATPLRVWRDTLTTPRHTPDELLREHEAARVAEAIRALVDARRMRPADIMVLSRKRESLRFVAQALRRVHVPYAAPEEVELMATPEARDLVALLDALVSPGHALSLAQALRSPLFGATDADLITLARRAPEGDWWRALAAAAPTDGAALQRARRLLPGWRSAAARLPPHDLLDRIVADGELRERVAATVPPEQTAAALDAVDAVLAQALTLDGARYATPYNFVRALRRRTVRFVAPAHADAVQLLTVHGAKGLEARVVFVMDAEPQPKNADTATLLIDWPVETAAPRRCAFVYAESACPPLLQPVLDTEHAARRREELNGLYVAMSRARERLVFSATEPSRPNPDATWWDRVLPFAALADAEAVPAATAGSAPAAAPPLTLKVLGMPIDRAGRVADAAPPRPRDRGTASTRLGQAVHRVLEWAGAAPPADAAALHRLGQAAAAEFDAAPDAVVALAGAILHSPACAPFFGGPALRWQGSEVPVGDAGEALRIDRLVCLDGATGPVWWVLDFKLQHAPEQLPDYRAQLLRYRDAVRRAQPGAAVRCAFVTGAGAVVEIDAA